MRIVRAEIVAVATAFPAPLRFAEEPMTTNTAVVAMLEETGGAIGFGYSPTFGFGTTAMRAFVVDDLAPRLIGIDLRDAADGASQLLRDAWIAGRPAGLVRQAVAMLEMALYDLEGQLAGLPLHRLWGQATAPMRAYASGGWRHLPIEGLQTLVRRWADQGFAAMKVQVGLSPTDDARRLQAVRDVVGPDVQLMVDANQRIPADAAVEWSRTLARFDPTWLEEPIPAERHAELAALRASTTIPIAAGESESELSELEDLLRREAVDIIQPDIHRAGITTTRAIGSQAARRDRCSAYGARDQRPGHERDTRRWLAGVLRLVRGLVGDAGRSEGRASRAPHGPGPWPSAPPRVAGSACDLTNGHPTGGHRLADAR